MKSGFGEWMGDGVSLEQKMPARSVRLSVIQEFTHERSILHCFLAGSGACCCYSCGGAVAGGSAEFDAESEWARVPGAYHPDEWSHLCGNHRVGAGRQWHHLLSGQTDDPDLAG